MDEQVLAYLQSRGYDQRLLKEDQPFSFEGKRKTPWGSELDHPLSMAWEVRSIAGTMLGVQVRELEQKKYRWAQAPNTEHLPSLYGSPRDYQLLWETRTLVFAEGIMDRVALKRLWPGEIAIFARLSKGIGKQLQVFVERHVQTMVTCFDNDEPGREATAATLKRFPWAQPLDLPTQDPGKLITSPTYGIARARDLLKKRVSILDL